MSFRPRQPERRIFVALDTADAARAIDLARRLRDHVGGFKIGLELFGAHGPDVVRRLAASGEIFLDLKLHDIPNTVGRAAAAISRLGVSYYTLHALGGPEMVRRAVEEGSAAAGAGGNGPTALAVTILTSHDDAALARAGIVGPCESAVRRLAGTALDAGAGGLVCSIREVAALRSLHGAAVLVVPGIRPRSTGPVADDDQVRAGTPGRAVALGADLLVVGRPITAATDPVAAASAIAAELRAGDPA